MPGGESSSVPDSSSRLPTAGGGGGSASGGGSGGRLLRERREAGAEAPASAALAEGPAAVSPACRRGAWGKRLPNGGHLRPSREAGTGALRRRGRLPEPRRRGRRRALRYSAGEVRRHGRRGSGALHPAQLPARCAPVSGFVDKYPAPFIIKSIHIRARHRARGGNPRGFRKL